VRYSLVLVEFRANDVAMVGMLELALEVGDRDERVLCELMPAAETPDPKGYVGTEGSDIVGNAGTCGTVKSVGNGGTAGTEGRVGTIAIGVIVSWAMMLPAVSIVA
jgi:hypothetical protein